MTNGIENRTWAGKYRPTTIDECILPSSIKNQLKGYVDKGDFPHLLFTGKSGVGKTTAALALCNELDCEVMFINASLEGRKIDTVRNEIQTFANTYSFEDKKKVVIMDEFDGCTDVVQFSLKGFLEAYESNCVFIFTANFPNKIIDALKSRCSNIEFYIPAEQKINMIKDMIIRACNILKENNIEYDKKIVGTVIKNNYPDFRKCLNELQTIGATGQVNQESMMSLEVNDLNKLMEILSARKFNDMRNWIATSPDIDVPTIVRKIYDKSDMYIDYKSIPDLTLILADYLYKDSFVADKEINLAAMLTSIMKQCTFK